MTKATILESTDNLLICGAGSRGHLPERFPILRETGLRKTTPGLPGVRPICLVTLGVTVDDACHMPDGMRNPRLLIVQTSDDASRSIAKMMHISKM